AWPHWRHPRSTNRHGGSLPCATTTAVFGQPDHARPTAPWCVSQKTAGRCTATPDHSLERGVGVGAGEREVDRRHRQGAGRRGAGDVRTGVDDVAGRPHTVVAGPAGAVDGEEADADRESVV